MFAIALVCGCQGGWTCHHIDELHPSEDRLPSLAALRQHSVSSLFEAAVNADEHVTVSHSSEAMEVEGAEEPMNVDDVENTVQSGEMMDTSEEPADSAVFAVTNARRREARQALQFGREVMEDCSSANDLLDVDTIIRNCIHSAMTMIKDRDSCLGRKTSRLQLLLSLLPPEYTEQPGTGWLVCIQLKMFVLQVYSECAIK